MQLRIINITYYIFLFFFSLMSSPVVVREVSKTVGLGVFACRVIKEGEEIFRELPLVAIQHAANRLGVGACSYCFRYFPSRNQYSRICHALGEDDQSMFPVNAIMCGCGEAYCSDSCRSAASSVHEGVCVAKEVDESAMVRFKNLAVEVGGSGDSFLLLAELYCSLVVKALQSTDKQVALKLLVKDLMSFCNDKFSVIARGGEGPEWSNWLMQLMTESYELLREALVSRHPLFRVMFDSEGPELFDRVLGLFERNNVDVSLMESNPLIDWLSSSEAPGSAQEKVEEFINEMWDEDNDGVFEVGDHKKVSVPNFHGTGLYPTIARLNHACDRNARLDFDGRYGVVIATKDIQPDQELRISYLGSRTLEISMQERKESLLEYGFSCDCNLCN